MTFKEYWKSLSRGERLVRIEKSGLNPETIRRWVRGSHKPQPESVQRLTVIDQRITLKMMRPDLF